jgi:DNA-directed RNA polymerase specialized sigma24 family protein
MQHTAVVTLAEPPELLARAATGEQAAWDELVERFGRLVWAVARADGLDPDEAADVSQVTWLRLAQRLGTPHQPQEVGTWLLSTARCQSSRLRRLRGRAGPAAVEQEAAGT